MTIRQCVCIDGEFSFCYQNTNPAAKPSNAATLLLGRPYNLFILIFLLFFSVCVSFLFHSHFNKNSILYESKIAAAKEGSRYTQTRWNYIKVCVANWAANIFDSVCDKWVFIGISSFFEFQLYAIRHSYPLQLLRSLFALLRFSHTTKKNCLKIWFISFGWLFILVVYSWIFSFRIFCSSIPKTELWKCLGFQNWKHCRNWWWQLHPTGKWIVVINELRQCVAQKCLRLCVYSKFCLFICSLAVIIELIIWSLTKYSIYWHWYTIYVDVSCRRCAWMREKHAIFIQYWILYRHQFKWITRLHNNDLQLITTHSFSLFIQFITNI